MRVVLAAWSLGVVVLVGASGGRACASAESEVAEAAAAGRPAFVVVTEPGAVGTDRALDVARKAQEKAPTAAVVTLDRLRPENAALVRRFRVVSVPVPTILVVASNGVVAGGVLLAAATPDVLVRTIPSPKKAQALLALSRGIAVFVVASSKEMPEQSAVFDACTKAVQAMAGKATTVVVDMADAAEKAYLEELEAVGRPTPTTVVFNGKGQKTALFRKAMTPDELVQAAKTKAPCCPGGKCG